MPMIKDNIYICNYEDGTEPFTSRNIERVFYKLCDIHGGGVVDQYNESNGNVVVDWLDDIGIELTVICYPYPRCEID